MKKQQLLDKLEQAWQAFQTSFAGLSDEQLLQPGVTESWSVRDILAHVTTWEQEALKVLPVILNGERLPRYKDEYGGINGFNALMTEKKRDLSLAEIRQQMADTHLQLVEAVRCAPDEEVATETRFRRRIRLDGYSHYPVHAQAIREWRERNG